MGRLVDDPDFATARAQIVPPDADAASFPAIFTGAGITGLFLLGANAANLNVFGGCNSTTYMSRRAGNPILCFAKKVSTGSWLVYEVPHNGSTYYYAAQGIYKAMLKARYDDACATTRNTSGSPTTAAYPLLTASHQSIEWDLSQKSTAVTRIGLVIGFTANNCGVLKITVTNKDTGQIVACNLLPTGTQHVAGGFMSSTALVSNGGAILDAAYVAGSNFSDMVRLGANRCLAVPVADALPAGSYVVKAEITTVAGLGGGSVDRSYIAYALYGTETLEHTASGAELWRMGYLFNQNDASANETLTVEARKNGTASAHQLMGGGHGGETDTSSTLTVNGLAVELGQSAISVSRARDGSSNATLVFDRSLNVEAGDVVTITGFASGAGGSYNQESVTVASVTTTSVANDTITYANRTVGGTTIGSEGTTADTAGRIWIHKMVLGDVKLATAGKLTHSVDGDLVTMAKTYQIRASVPGIPFQVDASGTLSQAIDLNAQSYGPLGTICGGNRATLGPRFAGDRTWRILDRHDAAGKHTMNQGDGLSKTWLAGLGISGYIAGAPSTGHLTAVVFTRTTPVAGSIMWVQDRSPETSGLDKFYNSYKDVVVQTIPSGRVMSIGYDRYDAVRPDLINHPIVPTP